MEVKALENVLENEFLRSCLEKCQIAAGDLDQLRQHIKDPEVYEALKTARASLDRCLDHAEFAFKLI